MATKLEQKREELNAKRQQLAEIFQKYPDLDMPADVAADIKARNDELTALGKEFDELKELAEIEKKTRQAHAADNRPATNLPINRQPAGGEQPEQDRKSIGRLFVESAAFKEYNRAARSGPAVEVKAPHLWERKALLDTFTMPPEVRRTGLILPSPMRRPMVADLIPQGQTSQMAIQYMEEVVAINAAGPVDEGAPKPESTLQFAPRNSPVAKIATVLPVTDELLADEPAAESYVEQRLRTFLELAEENQLVNGNGVPPALTGIMNVLGVLNQPKAADPTPDAIYKAMVQIMVNSFLDPSGIVIHPLDWQDIRLLKTADGVYIWGSPADPGPERIWGLPVVKTTVATQNTAIVGAFDTACQIFRREEVSFAISDQHADFFVRNQVMLRVEERLAFVVYRPQAFCLVSGI